MYVDTDEVLGAVAVGLLAGALAGLAERQLQYRLPEATDDGYRLTETEVRQLDLGRTVRLYRSLGAPDLEVSAEPVDDEGGE